MALHGKYLKELLEDMYYRELDRNETINASLSLPRGIVMALIGVAWYYLQDLLPLKWHFWAVVLGLIWLVLVLNIVCAIYFLVRAMYNYRYGYVSKPGELAEYVADLEAYYRSVEAVDIDERVEEDLRVVLISQYSMYGDMNTLNNEVKLAYRRKANTCIVISLIALLLSLVPFLVVHYPTSTV